MTIPPPVTLICIKGLGADGRSPQEREQRIVIGGALLDLVLVAVEIGGGDLEQENCGGDAGGTPPSAYRTPTDWRWRRV